MGDYEAWGDAPRNPMPPSDCPLGLIPCGDDASNQQKDRTPHPHGSAFFVGRSSIRVTYMKAGERAKRCLGDDGYRIAAPALCLAVHTGRLRWYFQSQPNHYSGGQRCRNAFDVA